MKMCGPWSMAQIERSLLAAPVAEPLEAIKAASVYCQNRNLCADCSGGHDRQ